MKLDVLSFTFAVHGVILPVSDVFLLAVHVFAKPMTHLYAIHHDILPFCNITATASVVSEIAAQARVTYVPRYVPNGTHTNTELKYNFIVGLFR